MVLPKWPRTSRKAIAALGLAGLVVVGWRPALAFDFYWNKTTGNYADGANWDEQAVGFLAGRLPDAVNQEIASIINGGTAQVSSLISPSPGGIRLGSGPQNILTGTGTLSILTGGNLSTAVSAGDANGNIVVGEALNGVNGTGSLLMTGGTLTTPTAVTLGGAAASTLRLSGSSTLNMATATLGRDFRITGPNVVFNATGSVALQAGGGNGRYTAEITAATHSPIKSAGNISLGGQLAVSFIGVTPALGQTWTLADSATRSGAFTNAALGADLTVTGATAAIGSAFRLKSATGGNGQLLQLGLEQMLVLTVNRDTGAITLRNPTGAPVTQLTGYEVTSPRGSLLASYKGISGAPAGNAGWEKAPMNSTTGLAEFKPAGSFNVSSAATSVSLGTGFSETAYALGAGVGGLGTNGEDLTFNYTSFGGAVVRGQVEYTGSQLTNNIALVINASGAASLKNDTPLSLSIDGYSITSSTGALSGAAWNSLADRAEARFNDWQETPATATAISETNPLETNVLTIAPGESFSLGDIGDFSTEAARAGLGLKFILGEEAAFRFGSIVLSTSLAGDFDGNSRVDGNDFLLWQRGGSPTPNSAGDLATWRANFGMTAATSAASAVPEPASALLLMAATGLVALRRRRTIVS
jgi:hypothetical protein